MTGKFDKRWSFAGTCSSTQCFFRRILCKFVEAIEETARKNPRARRDKTVGDWRVHDSKVEGLPDKWDGV